MRKLLVLAALALVAGLITLGGNQAQAINPVICGDTLSTANTTTTLTHDLTCATAPGLTIGADGITLDCAGHKITGPGSGAGILLSGVSGVTVKNCKVENFAVGISLQSSDGNFLVKNNVTGSTSIGSGGFTLVGSDGNVLEKNEAEDNTGRGFLLGGDSDDNFLVNNEAKNNGFRGFDAEGSSDGNVLFKNEAKDNGSAGFVVGTGSTDNTLKDNEAKDSIAEGFAMLSPGNLLVDNETSGNGSFGIRDSTGPANTYIGNTCSEVPDSSPTGLC